MASGLKNDVLGLTRSIVMAIAGAAPAFSIAATMATLIGAVGVLAPASLVYCGLIMLGIVFAFMQLNALDPNAGASYSWVSRVFGKKTGFFAGWALLVSSALFMVSATIPAGSATLLLIAPQLVDSQQAVTACAAFWLVAVTVVIVKGIDLTGRLQSVMTACELVILLAVSIAVAVEFGPNALHELSWQQFLPTAFTPATFAGGAVIALYFFWGWDVSLNLTEETVNSRQVPGKGAVGAQIVLLIAFAGFAAITLLALQDDEIKRAGTNIVFAVADRVFPRPWSYLAVLAVMLSTIGTLETSMLQFARTLYAKSRDGVMHPRWSLVRDEWGTPHMATFLIAFIGLLLLVSSLASTGIAAVMKQSIDVIGIQAAFYYGLAGFACAWHFRRRAQRSLWVLLGSVIWPAASALVLWWAATMTLLSIGAVSAGIAVGSLLLGIIPLYFAGKESRGLN
jgi:amino acid transporter